MNVHAVAAVVLLASVSLVGCSEISDGVQQRVDVIDDANTAVAASDALAAGQLLVAAVPARDTVTLSGNTLTAASGQTFTSKGVVTLFDGGTVIAQYPMTPSASTCVQVEYKGSIASYAITGGQASTGCSAR